MNKNKHNNIKTQTSADVGIGNGGRVHDTGKRQPQVCKQVNNTLQYDVKNVLIGQSSVWLVRTDVATCTIASLRASVFMKCFKCNFNNV